jgi:hypothetical protein
MRMRPGVTEEPATRMSKLIAASDFAWKRNGAPRVP